MAKWFKGGVSLVLLIVLIYYFRPLIGEIQEAAELFSDARWIWLPVALLVQIVSYGFLTWLNALSLLPFQGRIGFWQLAGLLTAMAFIQVAIPSAGVSGVALRVRLLGKFGYKAEEALFSLAVETIAEIIALVSVALIGVAYLLQVNRLTALELFWLLIASAGFVGILSLGWRLLKDRDKSSSLLEKLISLWNRLASGYKRLEARIYLERLNTFQDNLNQYRQVPLWKLCLASYGKVLLDAATMWAGFYLVGYTLSASTLILGYGLILTFSGVAAFPGGLGMADAYVPVVFSWLDVPGSVALAAGLIYRLIAYWLLRFIGFISWQIIEARY